MRFVFTLNFHDRERQTDREIERKRGKVPPIQACWGGWAGRKLGTMTKANVHW